MPSKLPPRDPSKLPGNRRNRVFIGGSYQKSKILQLRAITEIVRNSGFSPIVANEFALTRQDDIHSETMMLLHSCGLAIFELSTFSGALMEIERLPDYPTEALVLFENPDRKAYLPSRMLSTFISDHSDLIELRSYASDKSMRNLIVSWLDAKKLEGYMP
jgi:hypothetical protein